MDKKWIWLGKPWQAFKTFALLFSFAMNLILLVILLVVAPLLIPLIADIALPIVGGLNSSFVDMNSATIERTIDVDDTMDIEFTLPLSTTTDVIIVNDVALKGVPAQFVLPGGGGSINGQVYLSLPEGLALPIKLDMEIPVEQTIPVQLAVAVDIPLDETELGKPFSRLQSIFEPLDDLLRGLPSSNEELFDRLLKNGDANENNAESVTVK